MDHSNELTEFSIQIFGEVLKSIQNNDKKIKNSDFIEFKPMSQVFLQ